MIISMLISTYLKLGRNQHQNYQCPKQVGCPEVEYGAIDYHFGFSEKLKEV